MALLWQKWVDDTHYEVRTAGHTRRLYSNGVFHSQYNPTRAHAAGVWDLLVLPALFRPTTRIRRVLVLGVGGGSVLHLLHRFVQPEHIVGIELNAIHLQVAREFFGIEEGMAELHRADAVDWLRAYRGPPFDMIIDDLFGNQDLDLGRAVPADSVWCTTLLENLTEHGVLVMNFIGTRALRGCACLRDEALARHIKSAFQLELQAYENAIGAFLGHPAQARNLRENIRGLPGLGRLDFAIRRL